MDQYYVRSLNNQQAASLIQVAYLVQGDIKTFQVPLAGLDDNSVREAVLRLRAEIAQQFPITNVPEINFNPPVG